MWIKINIKFEKKKKENYMNENVLVLVLFRVEYFWLIFGVGKYNYFFIIGLVMLYFIDFYFLGNFYRKIVVFW